MGVTPYSSNHREKNTNMSMHTEPLRSKLSQTIFTVVASAATRLGCIDVPSRRELTTANNDSAACSGHYTCLEYKEQEQTQSNTSSKKMQETPILYTQTFISLSTHKNHGPAAATTKTNLKSTWNSEKMKIQPPTPQPTNPGWELPTARWLSYSTRSPPARA